MKRMINVFLFAFAFASIFAPAANAKTVSGVDVPEKLKTDVTELKLNGAGIRTKWFMDIYVGALYLADAGNDAKAIIGADEPMALRLHMLSGLVDSKKMKSATTDGFDAATNGNVAPIQTHIDKMIDVFSEDINENDVFNLVYVPGTGVNIYKNNELKSTVNGGMEFKQALFGIWLSDKPAQKKLKNAMLGTES